MILLFLMLNKVAGIYGLITIATGGTVSQLSLYFYSVACLVAIWWWGLKAVLSENPQNTLYLAYAFFLDHVLSTIWLLYFGIDWWYFTAHDGRREVHSAAQEQLVNSIVGHNMTDAERAIAAHSIWDQEKSTAAGVLAATWLIKWYFAAIIFSYAIHLRNGSYRTLPATQIPLTSLPHPDTSLIDEEDEDDEFLDRQEYTLSKVHSPKMHTPRTPHSPRSASSVGSSRGGGRRMNGDPYSGRSPNGEAHGDPEVVWERLDEDG